MPTMCSTCGRTSGKCESCRKVDAVLTPERTESILRKCAGYTPGIEISEVFARAISREVVAILAEPREPLTGEQLAKYLDSYNNDRRLLGDEDAFYGVMLDVWDAANGISTPAASGKCESGGE